MEALDFDFLPVSEKNKKDIIKKYAKQIINDLVKPKKDLVKLYNYYYGYRDAEQFQYLSDNYGFGTPSVVEFTPLVKKHIDGLVNEYMSVPTQKIIGCKDKDTLSIIHNDLKERIDLKLKEFYQNDIYSLTRAIVSGKSINPLMEKKIEDIINKEKSSYSSEYEIAASKVLDRVFTLDKYELKQHIRNMMLDFLISGQFFYRVKPSLSESDFEIEDLSPLQVFPEYGYTATQKNQDTKVVVVKYLTRQAILQKYGHHLNSEDIDRLKSSIDNLHNKKNYSIWSNTSLPSGYLSYRDLQYHYVVPGFSKNTWDNTGTVNAGLLYPVFEVEWLSPNKQEDGKYRIDRYEAIFIGNDICIPLGVNDTVIRSTDDPLNCSLSVKSYYFQSKGFEPYSLMKTTMNLQDKYDIMLFWRDNIVAMSGSVGMQVNLNHIPTFLDEEDLTQRVIKWLALKKQGIAITNPSQDGNTFNDNTSNQTFDHSLRLNAIQAIQLVIAQIEETCSSVTGMFRERLNGITQHDAVSNVKVGVNNSFIITKHFYDQMDSALNNLLTDVLNTAKVVYKEGINGVLTLGEYYNEIFTSLPSNFSTVDFYVTIESTSDIIRQIEQIKELAMQLVATGRADETILLEVLTSKSLTQMKDKVEKALAKKKEENNELQQLAQANNQLQDQLKQLETALAEAGRKIQEFENKQLNIAERKLELDHQFRKDELRMRQEQFRQTMEKKEKQLEIELLEIRDRTGKNNKIKDIF